MTNTGDPNLIAFQDSLRSVRSFVSGLSGGTQDQTWAGEDGLAINAPYQYTVRGGSGVYAVEGAAATVGQPQTVAGVPVSTLLLIGAALVAAYVVMR